VTPIAALWLPILISIVFVFVASSIVHMAMPWHKGDYPALPNQDAVADALRPLAIPPGDYMLPRGAGMSDMKSPAFQDKMNRGPVIIMTVLPNGMSKMGPMFVQWTIFIAVVTFFAAYVASRALPSGVDYKLVFRIVSTVAFAGYALAEWPISIWYRRGFGLAAKNTFDALIYALLTGGVFGWLWPK
jgi:hypothetical protein